MGYISGLVKQNMKEIGLRGNSTERGNIPGLMVSSIQETGNQGKYMEKENMCGLTGEDTLVRGLMISKMDMAYTTGLMAPNMKVNG